MGQVLYTADPHVFHPLVSGLRGFRNADGTPDVTAHNEWYEDMWRSHITADDRVFILGDLTVGGRARVDLALAFFAQLPGRKVWVSGNHDEIHPHSPRALDAMSRWQAVFEVVSPMLTRRINGHHVNLSHFTYEPVEYDARPTGPTQEMVDRFGPYRVPDTGRWLLHGHTHYEDKLSGPRQIHVGVDGWRAPVPESTIADLIRKNS